MSGPRIPCSNNGYKEMNPTERLRIYHPWTRAKETPELGSSLEGHGIFRTKGIAYTEFSQLLDCTSGAQDLGIPCPNSPEVTSRCTRTSALDPSSRGWTAHLASPPPLERESRNSCLQGRSGGCLGLWAAGCPGCS